MGEASPKPSFIEDGNRRYEEGTMDPSLIQGAIFLGKELSSVSPQDLKDALFEITSSTTNFRGRMRFSALLRTFGQEEVTEFVSEKPILTRMKEIRIPEIIRIRDKAIVEPEDLLNPRGLIALSFIGDAQQGLRDALSFPDIPEVLKEDLKGFQSRLLDVIIHLLNGENKKAAEEYDDIRYEINRINDAANTLIGEQGLDRWVLSVIRMEAFWENAVLSLRNSQHPFKEQNWDTWRLSFIARDSLAAFEKGGISELERAQAEESDATDFSDYPLNFISEEMKGKINTLFSSVEEARKALQKENSIEAVLELALLTEKFLAVSRNIIKLNLERGFFSHGSEWDYRPLDHMYEGLLATLEDESDKISALEGATDSAEPVDTSAVEVDKSAKSVETLVKDARKEINMARKFGKDDEEIWAIYERYFEQIQASLDQMAKPFNSYMAIQSMGSLRLEPQALGEEDFGSTEALNLEKIMNAAVALEIVANSEQKPEEHSFRTTDFTKLTTALQILIPSLSVESLVYAKDGNWSEVENNVPFSRVNWILSEATSDEVFFYGINDLGEACVLSVKVNDESKPGVAESEITSWNFQIYPSKSDMPEETRLKIKRIMQNEEVREALRARIKEVSLANDLGLIVTVGSLVRSDNTDSPKVPVPGSVIKKLVELTTRLEEAATNSMCQDGSAIKVEDFVDALSSLHNAIFEGEAQSTSENPPEREDPDELARWYIHKISIYLRNQLKTIEA